MWVEDSVMEWTRARPLSARLLAAATCADVHAVTRADVQAATRADIHAATSADIHAATRTDVHTAKHATDRLTLL